MPDSSTASCAALPIETPTLLGWPLWVSGRIRPTRTGPVPTVWPTVGPASGCDWTSGTGAALTSGEGLGESPSPLEVQPANASSAQPASARAAAASPRFAALEAPVGMKPSPARDPNRGRESLGPAGILPRLPALRAVYGPRPLFAPIVAFSAPDAMETREADEVRDRR